MSRNFLSLLLFQWNAHQTAVFFKDFNFTVRSHCWMLHHLILLSIYAFFLYTFYIVDINKSVVLSCFSWLFNIIVHWSSWHGNLDWNMYWSRTFYGSTNKNSVNPYMVPYECICAVMKNSTTQQTRWDVAYSASKNSFYLLNNRWRIGQTSKFTDKKICKRNPFFTSCGGQGWVGVCSMARRACVCSILML